MDSHKEGSIRLDLVLLVLVDNSGRQFDRGCITVVMWTSLLPFVYIVGER